MSLLTYSLQKDDFPLLPSLSGRVNVAGSISFEALSGGSSPPAPLLHRRSWVSTLIQCGGAGSSVPYIPLPSPFPRLQVFSRISPSHTRL